MSSQFGSSWRSRFRDGRGLWLGWCDLCGREIYAPALAHDGLVIHPDCKNPVKAPSPVVGPRIYQKRIHPRKESDFGSDIY